ncbi:7,8-dihydro-8-oxoguanine-triphosphatase [Halioglobus sp. HI00S01]|uniref:8-oxo-dGTP diphosphatase MutT n=1 Tax=Halioglobus sp. HI00S01 TaxID=1822214 RepID=UPI0007C30391|nr:8-oxo-dGTP diphosphatase MutT [Halioglobus sp. HI00S01]KZX59489.1 7,8-dihydro-8-oxoguanine-triphosphatase [Halioglobus sp. HI00S01]
MTEVHVAVGVILDAERNILLTRRAADAHQGSLWEFPGGKVEAGETVQAALSRELAEELGIEVSASEPLIEIRHDYGDKRVFLDVHIVPAFAGQPSGLEQQPMAWVSAAELAGYEFPAANVPIVKAVQAYLR